MSMFVGATPFWRLNQSWYSGQSAANSRYFGGISFFGGNAYGNSIENTISAATTAMNALGSATMSYYMDAAILAAQQGVDRVNKAAAAKNDGGLNKPVGDISNQVTFSGALSGLVNFGADGPSASGGFRFLSGTALKDAFNLAMLAERSHGEAIDQVSVTGNMLTASTSGPEAHPVFTITLQPDSGMWTFKLLNPIDGTPDKTTNFVTALNLSGLMQGVKSTGKTIALPSNIIVSVYGDLGSASGKANRGSVHQAGLVYTPPAKIATPLTVIQRTPYTPPINPATGYAYVTTSAIAITGISVSVLA